MWDKTGGKFRLEAALCEKEMTDQELPEMDLAHVGRHNVPMIRRPSPGSFESRTVLEFLLL